MNAKATIAAIFLVSLFLYVPLYGPATHAGAKDNLTFVGSETCGRCHPDQYNAYSLNSKKARSFSSIQRMAVKLTSEELKECYGCHTTGYGRPGGFRSELETPQLKHAGCEVCHGPGSLHAESQDPADLAKVSIEACRTCHNAERVAAFNFKPLLFGGAH